MNLDASAYRGEDSKRTMHEVLIDNTIDDVDRNLDREKLIDAIRGALCDLTPREEAVLRLRFGISEPDLELAKRGK